MIIQGYYSSGAIVGEYGGNLWYSGAIEVRDYIGEYIVGYSGVGTILEWL